MVTAAQFRTLALALPETEERSHFGTPDFRVRNKIFATLGSAKRGTLKLAPETQALLLDARPGVFTPAAGAWGRLGWTNIELAGVEIGVIRELLAEAFQRVAPKRLAAPVPKTAPAAKKRSVRQSSARKHRIDSKRRR